MMKAQSRSSAKFLAGTLITASMAICFCSGAISAEQAFRPVAVREGNLTISLDQLVTNVSWHNPKRAARKGDLRSTIASFSVTENGQPTPWKPMEYSVVDVRGKRWWASAQILKEKDAAKNCQFELSPDDSRQRKSGWPESGIWSMRVGFSRTSGFTADELWTVRGVAVPLPNERSQFKILASTDLQGTSLQLRPLVPPGGSVGEGIRIYPLDKKPRVTVSTVMAPKRDDLRVDLVKVVDNQGREVNASLYLTKSGYCEMPPDKDPERRFHFYLNDLADDAKTVDLTFAVHRTRYVEFKVEPLQAKAVFRQATR